MEECELCGTKMKDVYIVNVDSVEFRVCTKCAQGKKIVSKVMEKSKTKAPKVKEDKNELPQLVENYGTLMHNAREAMKLPLKVLAEMLNEKETFLSRVEQQSTLPSVELTRKLEKALGIKLTESASSENDKSKGSGKSEGATLGEFLTKK